MKNSKKSVNTCTMPNRYELDISPDPESNLFSRAEMKRLVKEEKPNLVIHISGIQCNVSVDPDVYSENDHEELNSLIQNMSKNIWIDRTYVCFPGNRFKDAFMKEEGWYALNRSLIRGCMKKTKKGDQETMAAIMTVVSYYLYDIADKAGYDIENIGIDFADDMKFETEYFVDNRKEWRF